MALRNLNATALTERRNSSLKKNARIIPLTGTNDENAVVQGAFARECSAHCKMSESADSVFKPSEEPFTADVEYVQSHDLKPLQDPEAQANTLLEKLDSKDWLQVCEAANLARQLALFHKSSLLPILDKVVLLLIKGMKNPRSALCKTSIMASNDLFKAYGDEMLYVDGMTSVFDHLLLQLLLKASQDKRFVCEEAQNALDGMATWISPAPLMQKLQPYISHRNFRVRAKAAVCVCKCVSRMGSDGIKEFGFVSLLQIAAAQLNDQLPEAREAARKVVNDVYESFLFHPIETADMADDGPSAATSLESWQSFCSTQLLPNVAQAIIRRTA